MGKREDMVAFDVEGVGEGQRLGVEPLDAFFVRTPQLAVAFSGGCDSAYLLAAAVAAGCDVRAFMIQTAFQASFEFDDALAVARAVDVPLDVIRADVLSQADVCANASNRCYVCKRFLFGEIRKYLRTCGLSENFVLVDGTNASDDPVRRPGFKALKEANVTSPLRRAGLTKQQIREESKRLAARMGLKGSALLANKPSFPCLAVYVPEGEVITCEALKHVADARGLQHIER